MIFKIISNFLGVNFFLIHSVEIMFRFVCHCNVHNISIHDTLDFILKLAWVYFSKVFGPNSQRKVCWQTRFSYVIWHVLTRFLQTLVCRQTSFVNLGLCVRIQSVFLVYYISYLFWFLWDIPQQPPPPHYSYTGIWTLILVQQLKVI